MILLTSTLGNAIDKYRRLKPTAGSRVCCLRARAWPTKLEQGFYPFTLPQTSRQSERQSWDREQRQNITLSILSSFLFHLIFNSL